MDWIKDGMVDWIVNIYNSLFLGLDDVMTMAKLSPSQFNPMLWDAVTNFNKNAVLPIAWSVLSLFLLLELVAYFRRSNTKGIEGIYWVAIIFLKIMIAKLLMDNMNVIIDSIFAICAQIVTNGQDLTLTTKNIDVGNLADALDGKSVISLLGMFVEGMIIGFFSHTCFILAQIVVQLRFIEIYVFSAVASLPFATLPSEEYGNIGKSFIKRMVALGLHAIFIIIVLYMYGVLLNSAVINVDPQNATGAMWEILGYAILVVIALFQTGGWSKSLCQVN
ncbi:MAG: CD0415/CD1112 family protein [Erysipelotrichaceae bacterium]